MAHFIDNSHAALSQRTKDLIFAGDHHLHISFHHASTAARCPLWIFLGSCIDSFTVYLVEPLPAGFPVLAAPQERPTIAEEFYRGSQKARSFHLERRPRRQQLIHDRQKPAPLAPWPHSTAARFCPYLRKQASGRQEKTPHRLPNPHVRKTSAQPAQSLPPIIGSCYHDCQTEQSFHRARKLQQTRRLDVRRKCGAFGRFSRPRVSSLPHCRRIRRFSHQAQTPQPAPNPYVLPMCALPAQFARSIVLTCYLYCPIPLFFHQEKRQLHSRNHYDRSRCVGASRLRLPT